MKKLVSLTLSLLMMCTAFSAAASEEIKMNQDGTYTVNLTGKTPGNEYSIVIVAGDYSGKDMPEIDVADIIYIDQVTADENGNASFTSFIPMTESVGTIYIGGDENPSEEGVLMTESGFGYSEGILISFSGASGTITLPEGITSVAEGAIEKEDGVDKVIIKYGDVELASDSIAEGVKLFLSPIAEKAKLYAIENGYSYAVFGDLDGNGIVDKNDYTGYLGNIASGTAVTDTDEKLILDIDNSGEVNLRDASILLRYLCGMISDYYEAFTDKDSILAQ